GAVRLPGVVLFQAARRTSALVLPLILALGACRNADSEARQGIQLAIVPNADGSSGCSGAAPTFGAPPTPVDLAGFVLGPASQVAAARGAELLYVTGADATVAVIDVGDPDLPVVTTLV